MKDAYYFPHDSNATDDPKIMMLISQLQMEGYGIYWTLLEHLRNQPDFKSQLQVIPAIAMRNGSTQEKFMAVVKSFDLFVIQNDDWFSESLIRRMQPYLARKEAGRIGGKASGASRKVLSTIRSTIVEPSLNAASTSKVKESKEKEINIRLSAKREEINTQLPLSNEYTSAAAQAKTFEYFWQHYHKITKKPKANRAAAFRHWKHVDMKLFDQRAAYAGVTNFFNWAKEEYSDINFIPKARTYLDDRLWEDDHSRLSKERDPTKTYLN